MNLKIATEIGKCLSNQIRFQIMEWLKEPEKHFPPHETLKHFNDGVCVTYIQEKTVILYHLIEKKLRYNELRKEMPTVTERTLSLQLKALEEDGLIKRKVYTSKPPLKVEYSLTDFGKTLIPLIQSIADWGDSVVEKYS